MKETGDSTVVKAQLVPFLEHHSPQSTVGKALAQQHILRHLP